MVYEIHRECGQGKGSLHLVLCCTAREETGEGVVRCGTIYVEKRSVGSLLARQLWPEVERREGCLLELEAGLH